MKKYNLIFLKNSKLLLSNKEYLNWRQIQNEFNNYQASVSFDTIEEVIDYLEIDYKVTNEDAKRKVEKLNNSKSEIEIEIP